MKTSEIQWIASNSKFPIPEGKVLLVAYEAGNDNDIPNYAMAQYYEGEFYFNDYSDNESIKKEDLLMPEQPSFWAFSIQPPNF